MADIFLGSEAKRLFSKRRILFFGDSNMRAMYKDLLWMIQNQTFIGARNLKSKLEPSYLGDRLVRSSTLCRGRDYEEEREYKDNKTNTYIKFTFITKCYSTNMICQMRQVKAKEVPAPDVIVMNSCLWDVSRWGPKGIQLYRANMQKLVDLWIECIPPSCLIIWTTALPLALGMRGGGFLVKQVDFLSKVLPYDVMEANLFAQQMIGGNGFDVLDLSYHLRLQIHRRSMDGIHWQPVAVRHATNLLLTHITVSWGKELPGRSRPHAWRRMEAGLAALKPRTAGPADVEPVITANRGTKRKASDEEDMDSIASSNSRTKRKASEEHVDSITSANSRTKRKASEEPQTTSVPAEPKKTASKKKKHTKPPNKYWKLKMNKRDKADIPGHAHNSKPPVKENQSRVPPLLANRGLLGIPLGVTNNTRVNRARNNDSHSSRHQSNTGHRHFGGYENKRHHSSSTHQHASGYNNNHHQSHWGYGHGGGNENNRYHSNGGQPHAGGYGNYHHQSHGGYGHGGGNGNNHNYGNTSSAPWRNNGAWQQPMRHHQEHRRHENRRPHPHQGRHR